MTINATVIQDSTANGKRITTFELEYPRFIHSEFLTHRVFSRNSASSRAIPVEKMLEHIKGYPAVPSTWGKNMPGMQSKEELTGEQLILAKSSWNKAVSSAVGASMEMLAAGLHKQYANRNTEFAQTMKTIVTATEWDNWFELRNHEDAQPEIHELARCMLEAMDASTPMELYNTEWHVPYVTRTRSILNGMTYHDSNNTTLTLKEAQMVSASCCAQVSYRKSDDTLEKAKMVYDRLINSKPMHASPVEHQAKAMQVLLVEGERRAALELGVTHITRDGRLGSGNFYGWIQFRTLI
jgi:thymidylate synthase ThyX